MALYHLARQELSLTQLLQTAPTVAGIYSDHLRHHLAFLHEHPELAAAFKQVARAIEPLPLEAIALIKRRRGDLNPDGYLNRIFYSRKTL